MQDGPIDALLHCGDGVRDLAFVENDLLRMYLRVRIYAVRGNCDLGMTQYPLTELLELQGVRIMLTHGHTFFVKSGLGALARDAHKLGASLVFFGHTHEAVKIEKHGITLINPGSLASYSYTNTAYHEVLIDSYQNIRENIINLQMK